MKNVLLLLLPCIVFSCQRNSTDGLQVASSESDTLRTNPAAQAALDTITLYEDRIETIRLPFERKEMLVELKNKFAGMRVTKEIGQQDGPDFPLYSIKAGDEEICFFGMDPKDTLKLNELYVKQPLVKDQYGLKVGDGYLKIKALRSKDVTTFTDYHQHTYAFIEASNIMYEISGDVFLPDTVDLENLRFTEEQMKDWTIEYVIWRKR